MRRGTDGRFRPESVSTFRLGEELDLRPIMSSRSEFTVQPTYLLRNTLRNETGLSLGVTADFEALKLITPFGDLGPVVDERLVFDDLFRVPLYQNQFEIPLGNITASSVSVEKKWNYSLLDAISFSLGSILQTGIGPEPDSGSFLMEVFAAAGDTYVAEWAIDVAGTVLDFRTPDFDDVRQFVLETPEDVLIDGSEFGLEHINLGRWFDLSDLDGTDFFLDENPSLLTEDDLERLYLARLFDFDDGIIDISNDPFLSRNNFIDAHDPIETVIFPTEVIPEPAGATAVCGVLAGLLLRRGGRRA